MKTKYDSWEYDDDNEIVRIYYKGKEVDGIELSTLIENWLG